MCTVSWDSNLGLAVGLGFNLNHGKWDIHAICPFGIMVHVKCMPHPFLCVAHMWILVAKEKSVTKAKACALPEALVHNPSFISMAYVIRRGSYNVRVYNLFNSQLR